jgi:hypothetical protein
MRRCWPLLLTATGRSEHVTKFFEIQAVIDALALVRGQMLAIEDASIRAQCASSFRSPQPESSAFLVPTTRLTRLTMPTTLRCMIRAPRARATGLQQISGIRALGAVRAGSLPDVMSEPEPRQGMLAVEGGASWWLQRPENRFSGDVLGSNWEVSVQANAFCFSARFELDQFGF